MVISRRHKLTIAVLVLYWPAMFILMHLSPVKISHLLSNVRIWDKVLHYLAYLLLVFLLWFTINPEKKVNWKKAAVWWILLVVVWYGVMDEWLQGYVGRNPDVKDFLADLAGAVTALVLLTILHFWSAALVVTGITIFALTNFNQINYSRWLPLTDAIVLFFGYGFFTMLWIRYIHHYLKPKPPEFKWLIHAILMPTALLLVVELYSVVTRGGFRGHDFSISLTAIAAVVATFYLVPVARKRFKRKPSPDKAKAS